MNDRLGELTGGKSSRAPFEVAIDINDTGDGGVGGGGGSGAFMEGFFDKVNAIKKDIDAVKKVRKAVYVSHSSYTALIPPPYWVFPSSLSCSWAIQPRPLHVRE